MLDLLRGEGLTDVEFIAVTAEGPTWEDHASGFAVVDFPVMPDTVGGVYYLYGVYPYNVILIDKQGRLVTKEDRFTEERIDDLLRKIRDLHAE